MRAILDTSVVIATDVEPLAGELAISATTLAELHVGVLVAGQRQVRSGRLQRLMVVRRKFDAVPVDNAVAAGYGQVAAAVVDVGRQPRARSMGLLIGASPALHAQRRRLRRPGRPAGRRAGLTREALTATLRVRWPIPRRTHPVRRCSTARGDRTQFSPTGTDHRRRSGRAGLQVAVPRPNASRFASVRGELVRARDYPAIESRASSTAMFAAARPAPQPAPLDTAIERGTVDGNRR